MPGRNMVGDYRYGYQGQEVDDETGKPAFQLRLYDPRINRWLAPDPYKQFSSPYLAMANNPVNVIDPDGGFACIDADGNPFPCPDGFQSYNSGNRDALFDRGGRFQESVSRLDEVFIGNYDFLSSYSGNGEAGAYVARGYFDINYGGLNIHGNGSFLDATAYGHGNTTGNPIHAGAGAQANVAKANITASLGSNNTNIHGSASGSVLSASANLDPELSFGFGESTKYGGSLDANVGAYVAEGELAYGFKFLGIEADVTVGASVLSAHAGVHGHVFYDKATNKIHIAGFEHLGLGIGEKAGFNLAIPVSFKLD